MLLKELAPLTEAAKKISITGSTSGPGYNGPNYCSEKALKKLERKGEIDSKSVDKDFPGLNDKITELLRDKKIGDSTDHVGSEELYAQVTKITIKTISISTEYNGDDDDDDDDDDVDNFKRGGSDSTDTVDVSIDVYGPDELSDSDKAAIIFTVGQELFGQYCDEVDVY